MKKGKWFWLAKDNREKSVRPNYYVVSDRKMGNVSGANLGIYNFCPNDFVDLTGIELKPGQQIRVRLEIEDGRCKDKKV